MQKKMKETNPKLFDIPCIEDSKTKILAFEGSQPLANLAW